MAFRRSLSTISSSLLTRRYQPCLSYILHDRDTKEEHGSLRDVGRQSYSISSFNNSVLFHEIRSSDFSPWPAFSSSSSCRFLSTSIGEGSSEIDTIGDVAQVLSDTTLQTAASHAALVNEVAVAAADSFLPVAALQHVIDIVHSFTGFNWWGSIIVTTLLIRGITIPLLINQLKATSKLTLLRPHLEQLKQQVQDKGMDPTAVAEGQKEMQKLFKEYGVSPFTPLKGLVIQGPIFVSFFLAISNMTEKVPSFKHGGAYWFTDLTTPDSLYIFPILTGLTFLITVECNMQEGMEGNPAAGTVKNISRGFAVLSVPMTMTFPKAIFCYWITSNMFSLLYGIVLKAPGMKKILGVPEIPVAPPSSAPQPSFSPFSMLKQARAMPQGSNSVPAEQPKVMDQRRSSSSVISQRLRNLENQVKGRKKNKKR